MTDKEMFYNIAANFKVFSLCNEDDIDYLKSVYKDKPKLKENIKNMLMITDGKMKSITKIELFYLLIEFCFKNSFEGIEICALLSIFFDILRLSFRKHSKKKIFEFFKNNLIKHAMDRPPYQINIFKKANLELITDFFIENIYKKFEFLTYMMTKKKNIELVNKDMIEIKLPHILNLELGQETLPRTAKILRQYTENKRPKTELEQKIEMILDFQREVLDKKLDLKFMEQDQVFNKKLEDVMKKKK